MFEEQYNLFGDFTPDFESSDDFNDIFEAGEVAFRYVLTDEGERGVIISLTDTFGDVADHFFTIEALSVFKHNIADMLDLLNEGTEDI